MKIPLEDLFEDIVGKAQRGLQVSDQELCQRARLSPEELRPLKKGSGTLAGVPGLAEALGLGPKALSRQLFEGWYPTDVPAIDGAKQFNTPLIDMTVNAYLIWDPETKEAAVFDTGADASELLAFVDSASLTVKYLFLTHTHQDHVADLGAIVKRTRAEIFSPDLERLPETKIIREGDQLRLGKLRIEARLTNGHSPGGTSYVVHGLAKYGGRGRRFVIRRIDGWRSERLSEGSSEQLGEVALAAWGYLGLSRSRSSHHCRKRTGAQPFLCTVEMELSPPSILEPLSLREVFLTDRLIEVDLGSGPGKFLVESALKFPDRNFLGIERLLGRVRKTCRVASEIGLTNLRVLRLELDYTVRYLLPGEFSLAISFKFS